MKRTLSRTMAVLLVGGMLLAGCGRTTKSAPGTPPASVPASVPAVVVTPAAPGTTPTGSVDTQLNDVDGLLNQIDGQVSADNQTPSDSD